MSNLLDTLAGSHVPDSPITNSAPDPPASVRFVPYNAALDTQAESFLPWMWKRMQEDDLVDYYFPGQRDTGFATFVRLMSGDAQVALVIVPSESKQWSDTVAGFVTWTPTRLGTSDMIVGGFVFFRRYWDHHTTDATAVQAFHYWFTETTAASVLGVCPALHHTAIRYNKRIGLHEVGRLPMAHLFKGVPCDAILYAITREQWRAQCR